jgi:hypothetical protein
MHYMDMWPLARRARHLLAINLSRKHEAATKTGTCRRLKTDLYL